MFYKHNKKSPLLLGFGLCFILASGSAMAATTGGVRMPRMEALEKLTVGPENHFQVAIGGNEDRIFFTRSSNLATRLYWRGLKGLGSLGQAQPLVKAEFDTKDPAISGDSSRIAYTSFEMRARGDICVQDVQAEKSSKATCADESSASDQPFWLAANNVAFIRRPLGSSKSQLVSWNLQSGEKRVLLEDQILSAHADPQGRWIVYTSVSEKKRVNEAGDLERVLKVYRPKDSKTWSLDVALPGLSGFPHFDERGEFVYFAQFSNDTNGDARIDGNDNGVLFRIPVGNLENQGTVILPEQLTTAEQNCNYPAPGRDSLYMTCAFEGTLDVYRIPRTGLVPAEWTEQTLLDAYRTSRSIAERTLIINALRYRFEKYRNTESLEKLFSHHFLTGEYQAALYFLGFVEAGSAAADKRGYAVLRNLLEVMQYRARERLDQISPEFVALLAEKRRILERENSGFKSFANLALAYVDLYSRNPAKAKERFAAASISQQRSPLEQYVYFSLSRQLAEQRIISVDAWYDVAAAVAQSSILGDESKSFVSSVIVGKVAEAHKLPADRLTRIQSIHAKVKPGSLLDTLLNSQEAILKVAVAQNESDEDKSFQDFNKIFAKTSDQYYLNRAIAVQAVLTLAEFNKTRVMGFVAGNWLAAAKLSDTEFMHAREQYVSVVLDKAYGFWAKQDSKSASQVFYSSVRLTDDQEAHLGFVTTLLQDNNRKLLDERYESLKGGTFTGANLDFAKAAVLLFDDMSRKDKESTDLLEQAEKLLLGLKDDGSRPAGKHFFLGFISHEKMLRKMKGFTFDQDLSQAAHHQYMIALDLARKSPRMTAQILQNLAMLHLQTNRFGLASGYFAAREKIAFESEQLRQAFRWNFAKALYRNGEFPRAAEVSLQGLTTAKTLKSGDEQLNGWMEKSAFYLSQADKFKESAELYGQLLGRIEKRGDENSLKVLFMHGWTLMKSGQAKLAANAFDKAIVLADKASARKASGLPGDVVEFRPDRYSALAWGFLTQMNGTPAGRIPLRANRMGIMSDWEKSLKFYALSKENWARFVLKDCASQASDLLSINEPAKSVQQMEQCLQRASETAEDSGESADESILETLRVGWMLSSRYAEKKTSLSAAGLETYLNLGRRALSKLDSLAAASRPMANRWLRLKAEQTAARATLVAAGQRDYLGKSDALAELDKIAKSDRVELLNGEERSSLSEHIARIKNQLNQPVQGK
ncbi:MAG: hypothetical protein RI953_2947 [Pseudomonadota bacterium]|jgi:hypothetical protein